MSTLVQRIRDLIKQDKMQQALKELEAWAAKNDDDLHNMVILQTARLNQLRRSERMGIMSREEASRTSSQIRYSILSLLEELPHVEVEDLAEENSDNKTNQEEPTTTTRKLFISYAESDRPYVENLEIHLSALKNSGHIASWSSSKILPGQDWKVEIEQQVYAADIILYIVSAHFISSDFIHQQRAWAEKVKANRAAIIVPVIARPCDWESQDFYRYQAVPRNTDLNKLLPISKWEDKDEAYLAIVKGLRRIIDNGH